MRMPLPIRALPTWTPFLALLPSACTGAAGEPPLSQVVDSAGVRIVDVAPERLEMEAPIRIAAEPHLRIGAIDGHPGEILSSPSDVQRLSDGRILIVESGTQRARLMTGDGRFERWIGNLGQGPGEYQRPSGGGVLAGDTLWIHDRGSRRILLYEPEGEFVRGVAYERPGGTNQLLFVRLLEDGTIVDLGTTLGGDAVSASGSEEFQEVVKLHVLAPDGTGSRLLLERPGSTYLASQTEGTEGQRFITIRSGDPLFTPVLAVGVDPGGGIWAGDGGRFEVRRLDPRGELEEVVRADVASTPVTPIVIEEYVERSAERAPAEAREGIRANLAERQFAETLPAFQSLVTDEIGILWIGEYVAHRAGGSPGRWWLVEPAGDVLGRVDLPPGFRLLRIDGDELLGVETDEFDVPYLVGYALERQY